MSPIPFLSKSRGTGNLISRIGTILSRFGISARKYEYLLRRFGEVTGELDCVPTFPITGVTLKRHPEVIRELSRNGVEFAVHGYIHTDYGVLSLDSQVSHFKKAIQTFNDCRVPFSGFRAPFVRTNENTFRALSSAGFNYDSSYVVHWDSLDRKNFSDYSWGEYTRVLEFYSSRRAEECPVLPMSVDGFIEIPVTMPDDEIMVERLGITDTETISEIWEDILVKTHNKGELFTVQLHPERILLFEEALANVINQARKLSPAVWIATLGEIAEWWKERENFSFGIESLDNGTYSVKADCSDRATILVRNCKVNVPVDEWVDGYESVSNREFIVESQICPIIGVGEDAPSDAIDYLKQEGYIVETGIAPDKCAIYFNDLKQIDDTDKAWLSREIEQSEAPLVRYWRWPERAGSALSVSGDIDSITLVDFALRIVENWRQNGK